jgi:hypothetical protein
MNGKICFLELLQGFWHAIRVSLSQVGAVHINCTGYLVSSVVHWELGDNGHG